MCNDAEPAPAPQQLSLLVWTDALRRWHARLSGAGFEREFDSPFELARFVATLGTAPPPCPGGLR